MQRVVGQHHRIAGTMFAASACLFAAAPAMAQTAVKIGGAAFVQNDVRGDTGSRIAQVAVGDTVFRDELITTAEASLAKIEFIDRTNVSLGPASQVRLDRYVYNGGATAREVAFSATKGAFRFFSGVSPHQAYKVQTPQATIGVRGTVYDVKIEDGRTLIVLKEGALTACLRTSNRCADLNKPGESVALTENDIEGPLPAGAQPWSFADLCNGVSQYCDRSRQFAFAAPKGPARRVQRAAVQPRQTVKPRQVVQRVVEEPVRKRRVVKTQRTRYAGPVYIDEGYEPVQRMSPVIPLGIAIGLGGGRFPMGGGGGRFPTGGGGGGKNIPMRGFR